jgi:RHS repeat-associated protein
VRFEHDKAGQITRLSFSGIPGNPGPDLHFGYDALRRLTSATTGVGALDIAITPDKEGRLTNSAQGGVNFSATYYDNGLLKTVGYNNDTFVVTYTYDLDDRLKTVSDNDASGVNTVTFTYDAAGRVTNVARSNSTNAIFTYDNADRLTRIQDAKGTTTILDLQYTLNADGDVTATNFTAPLLPVVMPNTEQFTFDAASQVKATGFTYDARGRLTTMPGHTFGWDGASRLITLDATTANAVTLDYDAFGDMTRRTAAGATTRFFYHHAIGLHPLVAERNESNSQLTRYYVWTPDGRLLYSVDAATGAPSFYHFDRIGSTLALTDGTGDVTDKYAYTPYGESLGHEAAAGHTLSTQLFTFIGRFGIRSEGPFYQMRARYYDPLTARFLSRDPGRPRLTDPRTLDPYLYALGNPARYLDATGADASDADKSDGVLALFFSVYLFGTSPGNESPESPYAETSDIALGRAKPTPDEVETTVIMPTLPTATVSGPPSSATPQTRSNDYVNDALTKTGGASVDRPPIRPWVSPPLEFSRNPFPKLPTRCRSRFHRPRPMRAAAPRLSRSRRSVGTTRRKRR